MKLRTMFFTPALVLTLNVTSVVASADPGLPEPGQSCQPDANGNVSSKIILNSTPNQGGGYAATAIACFKNPIQKVWQATRTDSVMMWGDTRPHHSGDSQKQSPTNPVYSFTRGYEAGPSIFAVNWIMKFDHLLMQGTLDKPEQVLINFGKTSGTGHIRTWRGKIFLGAVSPNVTVLTMVAAVDADRTSQGDTEAVATELIGRVRQQTTNLQLESDTSL